jgi:hypothetical protein
MFRKYIGRQIVVLLLLLAAAASYGQSFTKPGKDWEVLLNEAKADTNKIKLLINITDNVMFSYFTGRDEKTLAVVQSLINKTVLLSKSLKYTVGYNRCLLLESRLLYIQNKDSAAAVLHKEAVSLMLPKPSVF